MYQFLTPRRLFPDYGALGNNASDAAGATPSRSPVGGSCSAIQRPSRPDPREAPDRVATDRGGPFLRQGKQEWLCHKREEFRKRGHAARPDRAWGSRTYALSPSRLDSPRSSGQAGLVPFIGRSSFNSFVLRRIQM